MKNAKLPKPRNPYVQHLVTKKSGAHGKSKKAQRRDDKISLRKGKNQDDFDKVILFQNRLAGPEATVGW